MTPLPRGTSPLRRRRLPLGALTLGVGLLGMLVLSLFTWRQGRRVAAERRAATDAAIEEYAAYTARLFAEGAYALFESLRLQALAPTLSVRGARTRRPSLDEFAGSVRRQLLATGLVRSDSALAFFTYAPGRDGFEVRGARHPSAAIEELQARMREALAAAGPDPQPMLWAATQDPALTAAYLNVASVGSPPLFMGFIFAREALWDAVGRAAVQRLSLIPVSFVAPGPGTPTWDGPVEERVAFRVTDFGQRVAFESRAPFPGGVSGTFNALNSAAGLEVVATLHPAMVTRLRQQLARSAEAGFWLPSAPPPGSPGTRHYFIPLLSLVLALAAALIAAMALRVWRERRQTAARRRFVRQVSHDLRTPLSQMRMYTEMVQLGRARDVAERRQWLEVVNRETRHLGNIVENLLVFSHLDARRARLELERADLGELVEGVVESYVPVATARRVRLVADAPSGISAWVDRRAVRHIVGNLLDNALKFGPEGGVVRVVLSPNDREVTLAISDEGPGIDPRHARSVWEPFTARDLTRSGPVGTGIGLAVVQGLVRLHGGTVELVSPIEGGTRCVVHLPSGSEERASPPPHPRPPRPGITLDPGDWATASVLVGITLLFGVAAWSIRREWTTHRLQTERAIGEYAGFGARLFTDRAFGIFESMRLRLLAPLVAPGAGTAEAPSLATIAAHGAEVFRSLGIPPSDDGTGFFTFGGPSGRYAGLGLCADSVVAREIRQGIRLRQAAMRRAGVPNIEAVPWVTLEASDDPRQVGYFITPDSTVYGFVVSRRAMWRGAGTIILRELPLMPPSLIDPRWRWLIDPTRTDSLVSITLTDRKGRDVYRSRPPFSDSPAGHYDVRSAGGLVASAALHPDLVARLRRRFNGSQASLMQLTLPRPLGTVALDRLIIVLAVLLAVDIVFFFRRERTLRRARRDFVASISHELRTPLAQIRMFTETLMLGREANDEERTRWLQVISREIRRLGDLLENVLVFSQLDADGSRLELERTDLGELIDEVVEAWVPIAASRDMRLLADAPPGLIVSADPRALRQVIVNLIDNALKYGPRGQVVRVALDRHGPQAQLTVSDEGPGIPPESREQAFKPFVRLGRFAGTTAGSGIGLSVVQRLVVAHGGSVRAGNAEGGGGMLTVTLPLVPQGDTR